jgi:hypothetical protein
MASLAASSSASDAGLRPITRTDESPRPIAQRMRLPSISLSVANSDAVTVQGSCQSTQESNVQTLSNPRTLGELCQLHDLLRRWVRLEHDAKLRERRPRVSVSPQGMTTIHN